MTDLFDLLEDDAEPTEPAPKPARRGDLARGKPPEHLTLTLRRDRRVPSAWDHVCDHPGCKKEGGFGFAPPGPFSKTDVGDLSRTAWWCYEHLPQWWFA